MQQHYDSNIFEEDIKKISFHNAFPLKPEFLED